MKSRKVKTGLLVLFILIIPVLSIAACSNPDGFESGQLQTGFPNVDGKSGITDYGEPSESTISQEGSSEEESSIIVQNNATGHIGTLVSEEDLINEQIKTMFLEEKIGQMFIVGFTGETASDEIKKMIQKYHVGGVILFRNNISNPNQLLTLTNSLKSLNNKNSIPLFLSVDEEGGRITRMPDQMHKIPSNEIIGKINNSALSFNIGSVLAYELRSFGFNLDFAPVLDIFSNPENTVIGDRAFGTEPEIVSKLGIQTMTGIREGGVIPVVKHFPGHGDTLVDSHKGLPTVEYDMKRLESFELKPFKAAIANKTDAIMIAHILMKAIDPENPASLSGKMITDVLRNQMGFTGVVVTDDMTMGAISGNYKIGDAVVKSVQAGSDIILVCHGYENEIAAFNALLSAVKRGSITEERLNESLRRILILKRKYRLADERIPSVDTGSINKKIDAVLG